MQKGNGGWGPPRLISVVSGFNRRRPVVTNGRIAIGVKDSLTMPPELAAYDLETSQVTVLTDLNPELRDRAYGEVEQLRFSTSVDSVATGWLIKPIGFETGRRYPLVVLHADERERPEDRSYLIDGRYNLSGHAAQPLAAHGFMVLFIGESQYNRTRTPTPGNRPRRLPSEIEAARENVDEAIRALARRGYVDTLRVGLSGWSRAAWYTDQLLIHSPFPFAAATQIDGGTRQYDARLRPYTDEELGRIRTPLLLQHHGLLQLVYAAGMADRLRAMGRPVDLLYFPTAPHSTKQPRHRWRSLTTHVDWWRFWLQDHEDPDPAKAAQYQRWRELRGQGGSG
jgi:dienelactone hydrolase